MVRSLLRVFGKFVRPAWFLVRLPLQLCAAVLLISALISAGWWWYGTRTAGEPSPVPQKISDAISCVCRSVPPALLKPDRVLRPLLVLPLVEDTDLLVTDSLRRAISEQGWYRPVEQGTFERVVEKLFEAAGTERQPVADRDTAIKLAGAAEADLVMIGHVQRLEPTDRGVKVTIHLRLFDVPTGELLFERTFDNDSPPKLGTLATNSRLPLILAWLGFALVWPPLTIPVMRRVVKMESNGATLLAILAITALPVLVAWLFVLGAGAGFWKIVALGAGTLLVGMWSVAVMSWVAETES